MAILTADAWSSFRTFTAARIALGRAGGSLPTREHLKFTLAHAQARDAVHSRLDVEQLERDLQGLGLPVLQVSSNAEDRMSYLLRPDLGRRLSDPSAAMLQTLPREHRRADVAIVVSDGLSALAAQRHAPTLLAALVPLLQEAGITLAPITIARHGRVAIMDEVGALLEAKLAIILLGERPGLGTPDSLGAYLEYAPGVGKTDAQRNCVSNIRPEGLPIPAAVETLAYLVTQAIRRQLSGVELKDDRALVSATADKVLGM